MEDLRGHASLPGWFTKALRHRKKEQPSWFLDLHHCYNWYLKCTAQFNWNDLETQNSKSTFVYFFPFGFYPNDYRCQWTCAKRSTPQKGSISMKLYECVNIISIKTSQILILALTPLKKN